MSVIYETERLTIRKWKANDVDDLFEYASKDEVTKFLSWSTYKNNQPLLFLQLWANNSLLQ